MKLLFLVIVLGMVVQNVGIAGEQKSISSYCDERVSEFDNIPEDRKKTLNEIQQYIVEAIKTKNNSQLLFVCTHNSRRSQFAQVWAKVASEYYGLKHEAIRTYSGGTEVTACNERTIKALSRVGFSVVNDGSATNPRYTLSTLENEQLPLFSKKYNSESNPQNGFAAIMVCSQADETCPFIHGCEKRIYLGYVDPKRDDGTPKEAESYDETSKEIAREMLYIFSVFTK